MFKKKEKRLECEGINSGLLINLKSCAEYMMEMEKLINKIDFDKMMKAKDEDFEKAFEKNKPIMTRLSELVVLVEVTKSIEKNKNK